MTETPRPPVLSPELKAEMLRRGYKFEVTYENGTEIVRMIRPDGTVAVTAKREAVQ